MSRKVEDEDEAPSLRSTVVVVGDESESGPISTATGCNWCPWLTVLKC